MASAYYPAQNLSMATNLTIEDANLLHNMINGTDTETITVDDGEIPAVRKMIKDNFYFKNPIDWVQGNPVTEFNQLVKFTDGTLWVAPTARTSNPILMGVTPVGDSLWEVSYVHNDLAVIARSLNVSVTDVMYSDDVSKPIVSYIYDKINEVIYSVPSGAIGKVISSVVGSTLNTTEPASYQLIVRTESTREYVDARSPEKTSDVGALNAPSVSSMFTQEDGKYYSISSTTNGLESTPDTIKMADGRFANRVGGFKLQRGGVFVTSTLLGHRVGDILYEKYSQTSAKILTDLSRYKPYTIDDVGLPNVTVAYTDYTKGNDITGDGLSWATAKSSVSAAVNLGTDIVLVRAGQYNRINRLNDMTVSKNVSIIAVGGSAAVSMLATGTWTKTAGQTNVYQLDYSASLTNVTASVYDTRKLTNLAPTKFQSVASIVDVDSTPNSFYHTGTTTYVHTEDNRDLTINGDTLRLTQPVGTPTFTFTGNYRLYMENLEFWGGSGGGTTFISDGGSYTSSSVYGKNCKFNGNTDGAQNGVSVRDIGLAIWEECESSANRRDGFNYHAWLQGGSGVAGLNPHFIEINCRAHNNGINGSEGNNQGTTSHEDCVGFRIGGDYSNHPDGGCIVDINSTLCYLVACTAKDSSIAGMLLSADAGFGGVATWWIDGAYCSGNPAVATSVGDIAMDGYNSIIHMQDTDTEKPISTRTFTTLVDEVFD